MNVSTNRCCQVPAAGFRPLFFAISGRYATLTIPKTDYSDELGTVCMLRSQIHWLFLCS